MDDESGVIRNPQAEKFLGMTPVLDGRLGNTTVSPGAPERR